MTADPQCVPATILALDIGQTCGWARSDGRSGVLALGLSAFPDHGGAVNAFQNWLADQFACDRPLVLAIERPFASRIGKAGDLTIGLVWAAHATAFRYEVPRREKSADQVRKWLIGRARRKKGEGEKAFDRVIAEAVAARGISTESEHAADAAALVLMIDAERADWSDSNSVLNDVQ